MLCMQAKMARRNSQVNHFKLYSSDRQWKNFMLRVYAMSLVNSLERPQIFRLTGLYFASEVRRAVFNVIEKVLLLETKSYLNPIKYFCRTPGS